MPNIFSYENLYFYVQAYHRDLLEQMAPPVAVISHPRPRPRPRPALVRGNMARRPPVKKGPIRRGRGERRSGSRRHRKVVPGNTYNTSI